MQYCYKIDKLKSIFLFTIEGESLLSLNRTKMPIKFHLYELKCPEIIFLKLLS